MAAHIDFIVKTFSLLAMRIFGNLFDASEKSELSEICLKIFETPSISVEKIISCGQSSAAGFYYDQPQDELVWLLSGEAEILFKNGKLVPLKAGDGLLIDAHELHRVESTSKNPPCIWIAIFGNFKQDVPLKKGT